jgi:hypothetical protein
MKHNSDSQRMEILVKVRCECDRRLCLGSFLSQVHVQPFT